MSSQERPYIAVVLNGELAPAQRLLPWLDGAQTLVAADGAANWLTAHGRPPHWVVGDLDSIAPETFAALQASGCQFERHRPDKDATDGELALLRALALGAQRIMMLGALGGRVDHALANVGLLAMPQLQALDVSLYDGCSWVRLIVQEAIVEGAPGDTLSLLPWGGDAQGVWTEGLAYPLRGESLFLGAARGVSNVLSSGQARVRLAAGMLLSVHTPRAYLEAHDD